MRAQAFALAIVLGSAVFPAGAEEPQYKGRTAAQWAAMIGTPQGMAAMTALQSGDKAALPVLTELAKSPSSAVRVVGVGGLAELGADAAPALPVVIGAMKDKDLNVRYYALSTAKKLGPGAVSAVPALVQALSTRPDLEPGLEGPKRYYADARSVAAEALGAIGPGAAAAIPKLQEVASKDDSPAVQGAARAALASIQKK
jgi:HEAT repeat protein